MEIATMWWDYFDAHEDHLQGPIRYQLILNLMSHPTSLAFASCKQSHIWARISRFVYILHAFVLKLKSQATKMQKQPTRQSPQEMIDDDESRGE